MEEAKRPCRGCPTREASSCAVGMDGRFICIIIRSLTTGHIGEGEKRLVVSTLYEGSISSSCRYCSASLRLVSSARCSPPSTVVLVVAGSLGSARACMEKKRSGNSETEHVGRSNG